MTQTGSRQRDILSPRAELERGYPPPVERSRLTPLPPPPQGGRGRVPASSAATLRCDARACSFSESGPRRPFRSVVIGVLMVGRLDLAEESLVALENIIGA